MKCFLIFTILGIGACFANETYSQRTFFTFEYKNSTVKEVIREIEESSEFIFFYLDKSVDLDRKVSVKADNEPVEKVLDQLFTGTRNQYTISDRQIVISSSTTLEPTISIAPLQQQGRTVTGVVNDASGPVIGANVVVKGTTNGAVTDINGRFSISNVPNNAIIQVSYIGYIPQELNVGNQTQFDITIQEDVEALDEVVVIGYGSIAKRDLTGAVASVKSEALTAFIVTNPTQALQGLVPGVLVSQNTGSPTGENFTIRIRGINSIRGDNDPLYVIDGVPSSNTTSVSTYDIESMEVLKDASATAIYGSRGANGVVLITTKKGKAGKASVSYDFEYGIQTQIKKLQLMDLKQWATYYNEFLHNWNRFPEQDPWFSDAEIAAMGKGTDWQDLMFKDAPVSNHSLNVRGGTDNIKYSVSLSNLLRDGLIQNSSYMRNAIRSTLDVAVSPMIDVSLLMGYTTTTSMNNSGGGGNGGSSMIGAIFSASPLFVPFDDEGNYIDLRGLLPWTSNEIRNPMIVAYENEDKSIANLTNINGTITFKPFKGFSFKSIVGIQNNESRSDSYTTIKYIYQANTASINTSRSSNIVNENILNYNVTLNTVHKLDLMAAFTYQQNTNMGLSGSGSSFFSDALYTYNLGGAGTRSYPSSSYSKWSMMSYLGRINYSYNSKYLATVSLRRDGSSRYSPGSRWGVFPSFSLAWRLSDESFMKNIDFLSDMKIRFGYGKTGSTAISAYATQNNLSSGTTATGSGNRVSYYPSTTYPGDLKWETTGQWDLGLDIGLFNQRIRITADYYDKLTTDLLNMVRLPTSSGYTSTLRNIGSMSNKGVELTIDADIIRQRDLGWTAQFNISTNKNRIEKLADGADIYGTSYANYGSGPVTILREGQPMGAFFLYKDAGLNEEGGLSYVDLNGDGVFTDADDRYIAGSAHPDFTYGLNSTLRYKDWDLTIFLQGMQGNKVYNLSEMRNYSRYQGMNLESHVYEQSWREGQDNSKAIYPIISVDTQYAILRHSDRFVEDASYLRLKNIALSYNIPCRNWGTRNWLQSIRVYVSAQDYLTFTHYRGVDPEVSSKGGDTNSGIDHLTYPPSKRVSFGLRVQF